MRNLSTLDELPWLRENDQPIAKAQWFIPSESGNTDLRVLIWKSNAVPRAVLQIAHGMAEHIDRYDEFARFAASHDILVIGADHLGHGKSVTDEKQFGFFALEEGQDAMVRDMYALTRRVRAIYPDLPYFLLGHSMGSMLSQLYAVRYPNVLTALLLSGTPAANRFAKSARRSVVKHIDKYGLYSRDASFGKLMNKLYNRRIHPKRSEYDWLSTLEPEVDKYNRDPLCGFPFTAAGYRDLLNCCILVNEKRWFDQTPRYLPIHFFAGTDDPVGGYGKGVRKIFEKLRKRRREVYLKLYPEARHEILNEFCRHDVYHDILGAVFQHLSEK